MIKEKVNKTVKAHIRYKLADGSHAVGVTTITGLLDKPQLKLWANRIGLQGIEIGKYVDDKAAIGTLSHKMILDFFEKKETDIKDYTPEQVSQAQNSLISFFAWEKQHKVEIIQTEYQGVSETFKFGGTFDLLAKIDGITTLIDFKTSSGIYKEMFYQLAGYKLLVEENLHIFPERYAILNIPRNEDESFLYEEKTDLSIQQRIFLSLLNVYYDIAKLKAK